MNIFSINIRVIADPNDPNALAEKVGESQDKGEISDGYHTFNELYYYRMLYNAAFFNMLPKEWVHKSKKHHDGEECFGGGWFIVMANLPTGQVSNHYELKDWDLFQIPEKEVADKWDGHTPQEAAERLHKYLLEKQGEQNANEIHPIFKVGDYIRNKKTNDKVLIDQLDEKLKTYCYTSYDGIALIHSDFPFSKQDEWELIEQRIVEQKPAWSGKDSCCYDDICEILINLIHSPKSNVNKDVVQRDLNWIMSISNRIKSQAKSAWSEEDERLFQIIIDILDRENHLGNITHTDLIACVRKLKSLIPQTQWKPSNEQMNFLWKYAEQNNYDGTVLTSLFRDLKKLREE